jgi:hypothetical protein
MIFVTDSDILKNFIVLTVFNILKFVLRLMRVLGLLPTSSLAVKPSSAQ